MFKLFKKTNHIKAWGLDIGDKSIKLAAVSRAGAKFSLTNFNTITIPQGYFDNGKIIAEKEIMEKIKTLIKTVPGPKLKTKFVHSCLPETQTFIKLISIPEMTKEEIPEAVKWASEHHIPLPLEAVYLDWQIVNHDPLSKKIKILLGAVPKDVSDSYTQILKNCDLIPLSLEIEATPLVRAIFSQPPTAEPTTASVLIDIGATRSSLIAFKHPAIQFTASLPFAGDDITNTLSQKLSLSWEQAEQAKIVCGLDSQKCQGALKQILDHNLENLVTSITEAINFYQDELGEENLIAKIILCGGGSHFDGIARFLTDQLGIPTELGRPDLNIIIDKKLNFPSHKLLAYTTAFGLALKTYE